MGGNPWSTSDWDDYKSVHISNKTASQIFTSRNMPSNLDPKKIKLRESRDSAAHPESNAIIIAFDVSGTMGDIAIQMAREGIKTTIEEILDRKPVKDPHIMVMGIGDAKMRDDAPLQVSQFETDTKIIEQLSQIYLEGGGGGNGTESYNLPWYFAATRTQLDCVEKRGKKGLLFTIGDEDPDMTLLRQNVKDYLGDDLEYDIQSKDLLALVQQKVLVSAIQVHAGENADDVVKSWDGSTSLTVAHAVSSLAKSQNNNKNTGLVRFA
jgi:hypothetical protein